MKRVLAAILAGVTLAAAAWALEQRPVTQSVPSRSDQGPRDASEVRFSAIDLFLDTGTTPLAAWQVEIRATAGDVKVVGIEGGQIQGFQDPPYYDPAAMKGGRIVIGAFSLHDTLPAGRVRVARLHIRVAGAQTPEFSAKVSAAGDKDGNPIPATAAIAPATR